MRRRQRRNTRRRPYSRNTRRNYNHRRTSRNNRRRSNYRSFLSIRRLAIRHPIATSLVLIFGAIILFRLSFTNDLLSSGEFVLWVWLVAAILFIAGLLTLKVWWRNHVSNLTTRHTINWKNK